jgi:hypothetical protein
MHPASLVGRCSCALWLSDGLTYLRQRRNGFTPWPRGDLVFPASCTATSSYQYATHLDGVDVALQQLPLFPEEPLCVFSLLTSWLTCFPYLQNSTAEGQSDSLRVSSIRVTRRTGSLYPGTCSQ